MFLTQLSELKGEFETILIQGADKYFSQLSPSAAQDITISRFSSALDISYPVGAAFIKRCQDIGILSRHFVLRCPECSHLLRRMRNIADLGTEPIVCHSCESMVDVSSADTLLYIDVAFSLNRGPFDDRQQLISDKELYAESTVACPDSIDSALKYHILKPDELYNPTLEQYAKLNSLLTEAAQFNPTTTVQGHLLEDLICELFSCCKLFRVTTKLHTETNQIDNFIRINQIVLNGFLGQAGQFIIVECKNEKRIPKGEYLSKLHSILHLVDGHLGIIISRKAAPVTFGRIAHNVFLRDSIVLIWFSLAEVNSIIVDQLNLLEEINKKYMETAISATKALVELGLYNQPTNRLHKADA